MNTMSMQQTRWKIGSARMRACDYNPKTARVQAFSQGAHVLKSDKKKQRRQKNNAEITAINFEDNVIKPLYEQSPSPSRSDSETAFMTDVETMHTSSGLVDMEDVDIDMLVPDLGANIDGDIAGELFARVAETDIDVQAGSTSDLVGTTSPPDIQAAIDSEALDAQALDEASMLLGEDALIGFEAPLAPAPAPASASASASAVSDPANYSLLTKEVADIADMGLNRDVPPHPEQGAAWLEQFDFFRGFDLLTAGPAGWCADGAASDSSSSKDGSSSPHTTEEPASWVGERKRKEKAPKASTSVKRTKSAKEPVKESGGNVVFSWVSMSMDRQCM